MQIIEIAEDMTISRDDSGNLWYSCRATDWQEVKVEPAAFPGLADNEDEALGMHADMIDWGFSEALVEEFIQRAGFDVTAL